MIAVILCKRIDALASVGSKAAWWVKRFFAAKPCILGGNVRKTGHFASMDKAADAA
ncbi:hypothetical protein [Neisseria shayeganii]|uniref:Uncharacterized protein n=1 Tax=Neisseria shayeganii 871 TaxID=1032488 RepID=G4CIW2_9NEIS|nr:hypothetical protein [Neisseria shayeganii]EGY52255.1 hypothetical protein HMPREF9371_1551 [Neisseria shayeganii 871]